MNQFQGGQIYWKTGAAQAYEVHGSINARYIEMGGSASWLGFPTTDEFIASTGQPRSNFEAGYITWDGSRFTAFQNSTECNYTISPSSQSFSSSGGSGTINVTTNAGCNRTGTSNVSWISVTPGGTGSGSVSYSVSSNSGQARIGTITIGGRAFTVNQSAPTTGCTSTITLGQTRTGNLQSGDCLINGKYYDAYTFNATAQQKISIRLNSTQFDSYLYLYRGNYPGGTQRAYDDDGGGNLNSRIPAYSGFLTLSTAGTYTIIVSSYWAGETGGYTLSTDIGFSIFRNTKTSYDFEGDEKSDLSVYRPSNGTWYFQSASKDGFDSIQFGIPTDKIAPADYDGDGRTDVAVFRDGVWHILQSTDGYTGVQFGQTGDITQPADFSGDGRAELVVYRPSNGAWYVLNLANNQFNAAQFGISTDKPVVGDYDGDSRADYAVYREGLWYLLGSTQGFSAIQFGVSTDKAVPADYDGDGKTDVAVFRPSDGTWHLQRSFNGYTAIQFGLATDLPVPADYDGDGKTDVAVFRDGTWYSLQSGAGFMGIQFGATNDKPIPNTYVP